MALEKKLDFSDQLKYIPEVPLIFQSEVYERVGNYCPHNLIEGERLVFTRRKALTALGTLGTTFLLPYLCAPTIAYQSEKSKDKFNILPLLETNRD